MLEVPIYRISPPSLEKVADYLTLSWQAGRLTNRGPLVQLLEQRLSKHFNVDPNSVVVCSNATLAIQGAMETCQITSEPWLVPSWTFPATYLAAHHSGKRYLVVDVDEAGRLPALDDNHPGIEVWPFGMGESPSSFEGNSPLIIDAAASFDALEKVGDKLSDSQAIVLSLHATKALNGTEGGVVVTNDQEWAQRIRKWINFGFAGDSRSPTLIGTNAKMSDADAAVALASLDEWPETRRKWLNLRTELTKHLLSVGLRVPEALSQNWATNYLIMESEDISNDEALLTSLGLETRRWWTPAHLIGGKTLSISTTSTFPNSTKCYESWLGLPMYLSLDTEAWKAGISKFANLKQAKKEN